MSRSNVVRWIVPLAALLAACSIPPKPETPKLRDAAPLSGVETASTPWPAADWWTRYGDDTLNALEEKALAGAPSLDEANARFVVATKQIDVARAEAGVSIDGSAQYQRQRLSENGLIPPAFLGFTWYSQADLGVQFKYDFDFWGKQRAAIEGAIDQTRAAEAERAAAALMLTTSIADTYYGWQADRARAALMERLVATLERNLHIADLRVSHQIDPSDVLYQARTRLAGAREQREAYLGSARVREAAIAALLGVSPADLPTLTPKSLPDVAAGIPASASVDLLARRPDIAASRWRVEASLRQADVARTAFYPDISISALVGLSSIDMGKIFSGSSRVADVSPAIHLPIFESGRIESRFGVTKAELAAAAAQYDSAIVQAAQDVATQALTAQTIAARRRERDDQVAASQSLQDTATARSKRGIGDDRAVLAAEAEAIQQRDAATALRAQAISTDIALTRALGGGYTFAGVEHAGDAPSISDTKSHDAAPSAAKLPSEPR
jgi:multidrug efflux system outer membrane protein